MPTYQYACTECGHAFEQFQSFSDDALTVCPECEGRLRKLYNAVGVVFKGSGFYRTDSRKPREGRLRLEERVVRLRLHEVRDPSGEQAQGNRKQLTAESAVLRRRSEAEEAQ